MTKFAESAGGRLDAYYFAFGQHDVIATAGFPDNVSAAAVSVAANGTGAVDLAMTPFGESRRAHRSPSRSALAPSWRRAHREGDAETADRV